MASTQKRWLTAPNSKLGKETCDLATALRKEEAWISLPLEVRQHLYDLLPQPESGELAHDVNVHPLKTSYKVYIEKALRRWKDNLVEGREVKKWRQDAMQAGRDRINGKWDDLQIQQQNEYWGRDVCASSTTSKKADHDLQGHRDVDERSKMVEDSEDADDL